jgi:hypothetical protein
MRGGQKRKNERHVPCTGLSARRMRALAGVAAVGLLACEAAGTKPAAEIDAAAQVESDGGASGTPDAAAAHDAIAPARDAEPQREAAMAAQDAGRDAAPNTPRDANVPEPVPEQRCVVFLHGKSGAGFATDRKAQYFFVGPTGNAEGWGGKQWLYFPDAQFAEVRQIVSKALDDAGCTRAILHGFSNGAAAVAKLYCRGVDFDGKVLGYIIDDPVPDHGADGCAPLKGVKARLYWTGGLNSATDGWNCLEGDWTCEGGTTVGIQKYAANLKLVSTPSVKTTHEPYGDPPEYQSWW